MVRLARKPHHSFWRASDAVHYIHEAILSGGRLDLAGYYLGQALHYIQDRCVEKSIFADHGRLRRRRVSWGYRRMLSRGVNGLGEPPEEG
jgi:hypothetical protein